MGHVISEDGVQPDNEKVEAIVNMPAPEDKKGLQRLLGMTKYLSQYIRNEAVLTAPLRQLLRKDSEWLWMPEHDAALGSLKKALTEAPVLRFFDPQQQIVLQADASKDGLGACLLQQERPVTYASRALTLAERNYAQIEKELLAVVFAARKFHQYVFGASVIVHSDHKPLEAIVTKPLSQAPARLQRMLLQLQRYNLQVIYTPGKDMLIADTLSRAFLSEDGQHGESLEGVERVVYAMEATEAMGAEILARLKSVTKEDETSSKLKEVHQQGWPAHMKQLERDIKSYWPIRNTI
ncbi:hypothetical protein QQF64_030943 [Cirrhinus molitorella]|uniref:Reverse transcriptase RNase H-like domain-containing protein n=1 Tax=Cirrhinus molitorella TaxID=172907 RepID=A0ABR3N526_9TELE